jgi:predicted AAA+ superfamily ATPase
MSRFVQLARRFERVLELAERLLEDWAGEPVEATAFERYRAFRWDTTRGPGRLIPIERPAGFDLEDLIGVEVAVEALERNTRQFLLGLPANHVLLYGERGTGKSSAVRGLLQRHAGQGLRLVEVDKRDLVDLPAIVAGLRAGRRHRFLIFCDDLSFGPGEAGYRELKVVLEGSLEAPPENVRIIATSNRRHLIPETMAENRQARVDADGELHLGEALDEKLALADRFGLVLGFYAFDQATYLSIVEHYLAQADVSAMDDDLRREALRFALARGGRSGRTARQFVDDWVGRSRLAQQEP